MATKRLQKLVEDAMDTPGAVRRIIKGPVTLNKRSLNIKFNRSLTAREKARLVRKLKKHMETGNTRIKVRFIGKIKVGINKNGDKRKVFNPLSGKMLIRGGQRYKLLVGKKGFREVRGVLIPPEISRNQRNVRMFMNQFGSNGNGASEGTETIVTPTPAAKPAPAPAPVSIPVAKPAPKNKKPVPGAVPITLYNRNGKVVNKQVPGVVPVVYVNNSGDPVSRGVPGAVPVVYTNGRGDFVPPTTPGATALYMKDVPSLKSVSKEVSKTLVKDNRSLLQKTKNLFGIGKKSKPLDPQFAKAQNINKQIAKLTKKVSSAQTS